ncbi:hypothetical protein [uncultured Demequina sp.]|nr:hypothetical protein [uncultured Demequina sp.]
MPRFSLVATSRSAYMAYISTRRHHSSATIQPLRPIESSNPLPDA